ncbi:MAG: ferritin family protein [Syntrophales bacterium]|nr:ferritin family protein [Syntrophales bacterium]
MIISKDYFPKASLEGDRSALEYLIFAAQAEKEGFPQIATLFRETAQAERDNAPLYFQAPGGFEAAAAKEADQDSPKSRIAAKVQEEESRDPYREALKRLVEMAKGDYYVCTGCGSTWEKRRPEKCPRCRSEVINFIRIG